MEDSFLSMDSNGSNGYPRRFGDKLPEMRLPMEENEGTNELESLELDFNYDDCDIQVNEIAELYSYTEYPEFQLNVKAFEDVMEEFEFPPSWQKLTTTKQKSVVIRLMERLETTESENRMHAARCILYLSQGCWAEVQSDAEQQNWARLNSMLLYELGVFTAFVDLLSLEIEKSNSTALPHKTAKSIADSTNLRIIISVLYTITEYMRTERENPASEYAHLAQEFKEELSCQADEEMLIIKLLGMVTVMCAGTPRNYPIKKVLLLLWKLLLVFLGGSTELKERKALTRAKYGLPPVTEDTLEIVKMMRSSSPPPSAVDMLENQNQSQKRNERALRRQTFTKQTSLDETIGDEVTDEPGNGSEDYNIDFASYNSDEVLNINPETNFEYQTNERTKEPPPLRILPWKPKVRQKDIDNFLDNVRIKFVGYTLPGDRVTLAGLPTPIHEGMKILHNYVYTSVSDIQIERELEIARSPFTKGEKDIEETEAEILYRAMLPNLPQYMIALLKIILAAAPSSTAKTYSINITADVLPEEMPYKAVLKTVKLGIDVDRHKEIIIKAVTAILLVLLKHFKANHIYQFEFMSQHLVYANCIPLILKFFNQNILAYISAKSSIPIFEFPACVIGEQPELTKESLEIGDTTVPYSARNMFSCINLLRIFNKLTKFKSARIMMMLVFKSAPILKRTLKVRHALMQYYVLKLLKMQSKYLGRQWRKTNMKSISAIYAKVRHRLNDDWAYGNDIDVRPWDFQDEETALRMCVDRFNHRRYGTPIEFDLDITPSENDLNSALDTNLDLDEEFKNNYDLWLEHEVYNNEINWDVLLS